ncbi:hypothetical protein D3C84_1269730 [compost metagenome]
MQALEPFVTKRRLDVVELGHGLLVDIRQPLFFGDGHFSYLLKWLTDGIGAALIALFSAGAV